MDPGKSVGSTQGKTLSFSEGPSGRGSLVWFIGCCGSINLVEKAVDFCVGNVMIAKIVQFSCLPNLYTSSHLKRNGSFYSAICNLYVTYDISSLVSITNRGPVHGRGQAPYILALLLVCGAAITKRSSYFNTTDPL